MKGTLFSADFIEDSNGQFRILEINTDTTTPEFNLQYFDYSDLINVLNVNNITKFTIIHKPGLHNRLVNHLSSSLNVSASFIDTIDVFSENINVIYPTQVDDSSDTFILRMAYDESSIFDSEYCKGTLNLLKLFADNITHLLQKVYIILYLQILTQIIYQILQLKQLKKDINLYHFIR